MSAKSNIKYLSDGSWVTHIKADEEVERGFTWIKHYEIISNEERPKCCAFKPQIKKSKLKIKGCDRNNPLRGAHVIIGKNPKQRTQYIIPVCKTHNDDMFSFFKVNDPMKVKYVKAVRARKSLTESQQNVRINRNKKRKNKKPPSSKYSKKDTWRLAKRNRNKTFTYDGKSGLKVSDFYVRRSTKRLVRRK
ncbi:MAG: hypothetical protein HOA66_06370 [Candidatus Marinimicrobia bacterium]|nr:hypothetical protein [Candidatus Neomarinimicrobiota bacterium]